MVFESWRTMQGIGAALVIGSLVACGGDKGSVADSAGSNAMAASADSTAMMAPAGAHWNATLQSMAGTKVAGTASAMAGTSAGTTMAEVTISGAPANGEHPWHIHSGTCASGGGIVGPATDYMPIKADASGNGKSMATVNIAAPTSGDYHVNVHMSPTDMKTIVACGDLKMGAM
ncbi:hypothetical protein [Gemmatimonas sp.]|uniref:hypothetical protein n=1 Tax=Gemmatimonas sp. TaxID=1962908 RepID=UPI003983436A